MLTVYVYHNAERGSLHFRGHFLSHQQATETAREVTQCFINGKHSDMHPNSTDNLHRLIIQLSKPIQHKSQMRCD